MQNVNDERLLEAVIEYLFSIIVSNSTTLTSSTFWFSAKKFAIRSYPARLILMGFQLLVGTRSTTRVARAGYNRTARGQDQDQTTRVAC